MPSLQARETARMTVTSLTKSATEAQMIAVFADLARAGNGVCFHIRDARRQNVKGLTDIVLAVPPVVGFLELKTQRDTVSADQLRVLDILSRCHVIVSGRVRPVPKHDDEWTIDEALARIVAYRPDLEIR